MRRLAGVASFLVLATASPALAAGGSPDLGFGNQGIAKAALAGSGGANAIAVQGDGRIVVAGQTNWPLGASLFELARYLPDGTLDPGFGTGGRVSVPIADRALAAGVTAQSDGRLVVSGAAVFGEAIHFAALRLLPDGSPDPAFGVGGIVTVPIGFSSIASAAVPAAGGKIVLAGTAKVREDPTAANRLEKLAFVAVRLNPDGSLDPGYGDGGIARMAPPTADYAAAIQPDGKLVLAGETLVDGARAFAAARLTGSGTPDPTFGKDGLATPSVGQEAFATGLALNPNGSVVLVGSMIADRRVTAAVRLTASGRLDSKFGRKGVMTTHVGGVANGAARQSNGKILVATASGLSALRLNANGRVDTGFGVDGVARAPTAGIAAANGVALQSDGMIVLGGAVVEGGTGSLAVARLFSGV